MIGLAGLGAASLPTPAQAALGPSQNISISNVAYTCKATNGIIDVSVGGPQTFLVSAQSTVPSTIDGGETIPNEPATLDLIMPELLMNKVRGLKVTSIAGSATSDVVFEGATSSGPAGSLGVAVQNLAAPSQSVPATGSMTIAGVKGTVDSFTAPTLPATNGVVYVELPLYFQLHATLEPPVLGSIKNTDLDCYRQQDTADQRVIGTIDVGSGCTDCSLPAVDRSGVPAWAAAPGSGGSSGSSPGTGTGTGGQTGGSGSGSTGAAGGGSTGGGTSSTGGSGSAGGSATHDNGRHSGGSDGATSGTTQVVATTALPDTGSPIRPWVIGLLALAVLARVALFARRRAH